MILRERKTIYRWGGVLGKILNKGIGGSVMAALFMSDLSCVAWGRYDIGLVNDLGDDWYNIELHGRPVTQRPVQESSQNPVQQIVIDDETYFVKKHVKTTSQESLGKAVGAMFVSRLLNKLLDVSNSTHRFPEIYMGILSDKHKKAHSVVVISRELDGFSSIKELDGREKENPHNLQNPFNPMYSGHSLKDLGLFRMVVFLMGLGDNNPKNLFYNPSKELFGSIDFDFVFRGEERKSSFRCAEKEAEHHSFLWGDKFRKKGYESYHYEGNKNRTLISTGDLYWGVQFFIKKEFSFYRDALEEFNINLRAAYKKTVKKDLPGSLEHFFDHGLGFLEKRYDFMRRFVTCFDSYASHSSGDMSPHYKECCEAGWDADWRPPVTKDLTAYPNALVHSHRQTSFDKSVLFFPIALVAVTLFICRSKMPCWKKIRSRH